jgi:branched-chain amino acid transport system substrate-binding protein
LSLLLRLKPHGWSVLLATGIVGLVGMTAVAAGGEQFLPILGVREGGQRFTVIPRIDGFIAYVMLLNARNGGINGVRLIWEECETTQDVTRGIECYERLKAKGSTGAGVVLPHGKPMSYALTERDTHDV